MQFLLLSAVCIAIFRPMKCTLATDAPGNSSVANHELAEIKEQVQVLGESLKADLDNLRGGQNILINAVYGQSIQLASCANSTAEESLKADLDALRGGQNILINAVYDLSMQLASCANSTAEDCDLKELWVSSVPGFFSEYGGSWAASKVIGPSDVYPRYGDIPGAWTPKPLTANDYIELEFESSLYIKEVLIYETYNAGAVKTVKFRNPEKKWDVQARFTPTDIRQSRIFTIATRNSAYKTNQIKLTLDCTVAPSWVEIDAVKIKGTKDACA